MGRVAFLATSALRCQDPQRLSCPNCGDRASETVDRKALVLALRRCAGCALMFRTPTDEPAEAAAFYNTAYAENSTTDMPAPAALSGLAADGWGPNSIADKVSVLKALGVEAGAHIFDFGCSWGYGSSQLIDAGYRVTAYEISQPRAAYAEQHLGVRLVRDFEGWVASRPNVDVFFSSHVLEHVPQPSQTIALGRKALKSGGLFVAFFPNGSSAHRGADTSWSKLWGEAHPNFLDELYLQRAVQDRPILIGGNYATPKQADVAWLDTATGPGVRYLDDLGGFEMMMAFRN